MPVTHGTLGELNEQLGQVDLFICSASFEDRSRAIAVHLDPSRIGMAIVGENIDFHELVEANLKEIAGRFATKVTHLALHSSQPIRSADNIATVVGRALDGGARTLLVDVTTFTRESLLILLGFLRMRRADVDSVVFVYAHAREYSIGDRPEDKWLSRGIREVRSVLGYPGDVLPSRHNHLIILVGFEDDRALGLIRECEPSVISLGLGDEGEEGTIPHQHTNIHRFRRLKNILDRVEEFTFQGYDAEATKTVVRQQMARFGECNTIIAPMNTKISTLGVACLALEEPSIQLCYAQADIYNHKRYSTPDDDFYLIEIPGFP